MKFSRYLEDTQTPEWKRAYIDYRALKKQITAIRKAQEGLSSDSASCNDRGSEASHQGPEPVPALKAYNGAPEPSRDHIIPQEPVPPPGHVMFEDPSRLTESVSRGSGAVGKSGRGSAILDRKPSFVTNFKRGLDLHPEGDEDSETSYERERPSGEPFMPSKYAVFQDRHATGSSESAAGNTTLGKARHIGKRSSFAYLSSRVSFRRGQSMASRRSTGVSGQSRQTNPMELLPLKDLVAQLDPPEQAFFTALDAQLDKIESFYVARESELMARSKILQEQLEELGDHKKLVQSVHSRNPSSWSSALVLNVRDKLGLKQAFKHAARHGEVPDAKNGNIDLPWNRTSVGSETLTSGKESKEIEDDKRSIGRRVGLSSDPEDYLYAKKKLKKAVLEHYRVLEVLQNYRILNLTGFRKALKKFEKTTKIKAQRQYMSEKVELSAFASDKNVREMMRDMEIFYATRFARGDKKRAVTRLRAGFHSKSHHYSVFRSGILLGLAFPALVHGLHASFQQSTRDAIPGWDGLLFIYGVLLLPVLFSVLVGANLLVWARARINYVFIFELDTRTRMDYREYYEIPSILLAGLCYAFWLSFLRIGAPHVSPTIWPLVWLGFCGLVMLDPLPLFYRPSRYWLLKNIGKLLISGTRRVEFADFWMGDQFCSLVFSLSNLYLLGCVYARGFDSHWTKCGVSASPQWYVAFLLASLPFVVRLVQSVKRYYDSRLVTHLINGGKYGSGIIGNLFFYVWRHQGTTRHGGIFALWLLFNTLSSIYASSWDFLMDWSVLRWRTQYPLLRPELVYTDSIPLYYIAITSNVLIRFIWVIYIPSQGPSMFVRTFIGAVLEMLRRWQWNFYRLENEHLGNMDQYRVTHEVPLPYSFDDAHAEDVEDADDEDEALQIVAARLRDGGARGRLRHLDAARAKKIG